jgi:hypothetical protein
MKRADRGRSKSNLVSEFFLGFIIRRRRLEEIF